MAGYHKAEITQGVVGEASKIREEFEEFMDAHTQINPIMELVELSDLIGAIELYLEKYYGDCIFLEDLITMKNVTHDAFNSNYRQPKTKKSST